MFFEPESYQEPRIISAKTELFHITHNWHLLLHVFGNSRQWKVLIPTLMCQVLNQNIHLIVVCYGGDSPVTSQYLPTFNPPFTLGFPSI